MYPYLAKAGTCSYKATNGGIQLTAFGDLVKARIATSQPWESILTILRSNYPAYVAVAASCIAFRFFKSGVIDCTGCNLPLDHALLIVGYGVYSG